MKAKEITRPGLYWLWPNAEWNENGWLPLWVDDSCECLSFYPATFDYSVSPEQLEGDVVGPIQPPPGRLWEYREGSAPLDSSNRQSWEYD